MALLDDIGAGYIPAQWGEADIFPGSLWTHRIDLNTDDTAGLSFNVTISNMTGTRVIYTQALEIVTENDSKVIYIKIPSTITLALREQTEIMAQLDVIDPDGEKYVFVSGLIDVLTGS